MRVLAATNRDLREDVQQGRFREDLLFRLEVVPLRMPPLRERLDDLPLLGDHIGERLRSQGLTPPQLSAEAMDALTRHSWPGNVRELLNFMERLAILHPTVQVGPDGVFESLNLSSRPGSTLAYLEGDSRTLSERLDHFEAELIRGALSSSGGSMTAAARRLRTDRANLYRRVKRLGLRDND